MTLLPGDFGLVTIEGNVGKLIRFGQWLNGDGFSNYEHAFIYIGHGQIIEAEPGGARIAQLSEYDGRSIRWSSGLIDLTDDERTKLVEWAVGKLNAPYSFLDYLAIALYRFHIKLPYLTKIVEDEDRLICSVLVADDYANIGVQVGRTDHQ
ncbi:MAG TPA: hypothetical protein VFK47_06335, partial [Ktedonobacteraceae bacterium]|nr:hypothetical protein [Ktedonobacteraceae bacterium]